MFIPQGSSNNVANDAELETTINDVIANLGGILRRDISIPVVSDRRYNVVDHVLKPAGVR
jgi:hypothetical protein